jgi:hypothetical protein
MLHAFNGLIAEVTVANAHTMCHTVISQLFWKTATASETPSENGIANSHQFNPIFYSNKS